MKIKSVVKTLVSKKTMVLFLKVRVTSAHKVAARSPHMLGLAWLDGFSLMRMNSWFRRPATWPCNGAVVDWEETEDKKDEGVRDEEIWVGTRNKH